MLKRCARVPGGRGKVWHCRMDIRHSLILEEAQEKSNSENTNLFTTKMTETHAPSTNATFLSSSISSDMQLSMFSSSTYRYTVSRPHSTSSKSRSRSVSLLSLSACVVRGETANRRRLPEHKVARIQAPLVLCTCGSEEGRVGVVDNLWKPGFRCLKNDLGLERAGEYVRIYHDMDCGMYFVGLLGLHRSAFLNTLGYII